jgi:peptide/nickel transport system ATP-binding protein
VEFPTDDGVVKAVDDVSFEVARGEVLGIVGESGSGKTVTSLAILGLLPTSARISGEILLGGQDVLGMDEDRMQPIRGRRIAMVFQDALAALNPVYTVGDQIAEAITVHHDLPKTEVRDRVVAMIDRPHRLLHPAPVARVLAAGLRGPRRSTSALRPGSATS